MDIKSLWHTQDSCQRPRERVPLWSSTMDVLYFLFQSQIEHFEWLKRVDLVKTHVISSVRHWSQLKHAVVVQNYEMCCIHLCSRDHCVVYSSHPYAFYCAMCTTSLWERGIGEGKWRLTFTRWGGVPYSSWCRAVTVVIAFGNRVEKTHISAKWWVVEPVSFWLIAWQYIVLWMHSQL